jgi:hypothetical protein
VSIVDDQPATPMVEGHRGDELVERVPPEPSVFARTRALVGLAVIVALVGLGLAAVIGALATLITRTLQSAVQ